MDIVIVLDGSNSIYPWAPMTAFLEKLISKLDIGPGSTQVTLGLVPQSREVCRNVKAALHYVICYRSASSSTASARGSSSR